MKICLFLLLLIIMFNNKSYAGDWPIDDRNEKWITSPFGARDFGTDHYDFHGGIDIRADAGTIIKAVEDGTIKIVGTGENAFMTLTSNTYSEEGYRYLHVTPTVENGATVKKGASIGTVFAHSNGPHLDFRYYNTRSRSRLNTIHPLNYLDYDQADEYQYLVEATTGSDSDGKYIQISCYTNGEALDFQSVSINSLVGKSGSSTYYKPNLLKATFNGFNDEIDFDDRTNCGMVPPAAKWNKALILF